VNTIRTNLSGYVTSNDSSVNTIRTNLSDYVTANDSSVNTIRTNLSGYVTSNDSSVNTIRTNLSDYVTANDSSVNTIRTNLSGYVTTNDSSINTIRTNLSGYVTSTDASVNIIRTNLSDYVTSTDSSVNTIRTNLSFTDSSVNTIRTVFADYITSVDASLSAIRTSIQQVSSTGSVQDPSINDLITYNGTQDTNITAISNSLSTYLLKSDFDSSMNTNYYAKSVIDGSINSALGSYALSSSLNDYYVKSAIDGSINSALGSYALSSSLNDYYVKSVIDGSINSVLSSYALSSSLSSLLQSGTTSDVSFNGNTQLGNGSKTISINKTPNVLYSLDVSGSVYIANNLDMSGSINAYGIFNNGEVFDSAMDGLSTVRYTSFLNAESQITVPFIAHCQNILTSTDGKYITLVSTGSGVSISNNYGATFTDISNLVFGTNKWSSVMSDTGQYQYIPANGTCYKTTNYGNTWIVDNQASLATVVSGSGKYVLKKGDNRAIQLSSNFGETYNPITISTTDLGNEAFRVMGMSKSGQVMIMNCNAILNKISTNFGKTWRDVTISTSLIPKFALSASGKYILAGNALSNNFGVSFEPLPSPANIANSSISGVNISPNGQYMVITNLNTAFYSIDYGKTWTTRATNGNTVNYAGSGNGCIAMPSNASYVLIGTVNGLFKYTSLSEINASSAYIANNLDMSGSINAYGIFNNGEVFDSGMDGLSTNMYSSFFTSESTSQIFAGGTASAPVLAMSNDGKYVLCTAYSGVSPIFLSTNYGVSFTDISNSFLTGTKYNRFQCTISPNGKYMFSAGNSASTYYSTDYGATWTEVTNAAGRMYAASYSGKYMVKCTAETTNNIYISSNYGATYTSFFTGSSQPYPYFAAISNNGQIIATCSHTASGVKISKNFGKTWTALSTVGNTFFVAMSASGRYILAGCHLSTDFGDTFTQLVVGGLPTGSITGLSVSATGQYMIITNLSTSFYSVDYGKTWSNRGTNGSNATNGTSVVMTANASFVMQATSTGIYKYTSLTNTDISVNALSSSSINSSSLNSYYTKTAIDSSLNDNFYNKTTSNATFLAKLDFDSSMNANYYSKSAIDGSINSALGSYALSSSLNDYYVKSAIDGSINSALASYSTKNYVDSSINNVLLNYSQGINYQVTNSGADAYVINSNSNPDLTLIRGLTYVFSVNATGHPFWIQTSDGGYNSSDIYNTGITNNGTQSGNITWVVDNTSPNTLYYVCQHHSSMLGTINIIDLSFAPFTYVNDSLNSYYTKTAIDASLNDNFYNKTTTEFTFLAKSDFDASMNANYYAKSVIDGSINSALSSYALSSSLNDYYAKSAIDGSINSLLSSYSTKGYVDDKFTTLYGVAPSQLDTLAEIATALQGDASFGVTVYGRIESCDSSINIIRTSLASYLQSGSTSDVSLNGNVQLGGGSRAVGINKSPNVLYALDISGDLDVNGNSYFGTGTNFVGINKQTATVALDISGSTNMSGNLALTKAPSVPMGSFDLSSVNMSVFNVSEKFTTVALSATPTLDYSTGGIFYMSGVNAALTTINITNVPTTLNRSISVTLILAQAGGAGTNCFTTGTLNVNSNAITYLKPDATALAAPAASRALIINQFIIIWTSGTPTVIAYLSSMG